MINHIDPLLRARQMFNSPAMQAKWLEVTRSLQATGKHVLDGHRPNWGYSHGRNSVLPDSVTTAGV